MNDEPFARYDASVAFLRDLDDDWAGLVAPMSGRACTIPRRRVSPTRRWSGPLAISSSPRGPATPSSPD